MVLLLLLLIENESTVFAIANLKVSPIANVTDTFLNLTATLVGTLPETIIIMAMIYTCLLLLTLKVIYLYFLIYHVLQSMIFMAFFIHFSE